MVSLSHIVSLIHSLSSLLLTFSNSSSSQVISHPLRVSHNLSQSLVDFSLSLVISLDSLSISLVLDLTHAFSRSHSSSHLSTIIVLTHGLSHTRSLAHTPLTPCFSHGRILHEGVAIPLAVHAHG